MVPDLSIEEDAFVNCPEDVNVQMEGSHPSTTMSLSRTKLLYIFLRSEAVVGLGRAFARKLSSNSLVVGKDRYMSASEVSYNAIRARKVATKFSAETTGGRGLATVGDELNDVGACDVADELAYSGFLAHVGYVLVRLVVMNFPRRARLEHLQ
ncbi:hypothetical protein BHM03_00058698 [Ensete ventricosum]|nr:hypothetical protein BHM03_00058698 [Ensete ventricosum]